MCRVRELASRIIISLAYKFLPGDYKLTCSHRVYRIFWTDETPLVEQNHSLNARYMRSYPHVMTRSK